MPITNYDTRPAAPTPLGSDRTEKPTHFRMINLTAAAVLALGGLAVAGWWVWIVVDRWINGAAAVSASGATVAWSGLLALVLWVGAFWLLRRSRQT